MLSIFVLLLLLDFGVLGEAVAVESNGTARTCYARNGAVLDWYDGEMHNGPNWCIHNEDPVVLWTMLRAYRSGGIMGIHWTYTNDEADSACMEQWEYYDETGKTLIERVEKKLSSYGGKGTWCALQVYRKGGVKIKQWDTCLCTGEPST